MVEPIWIVAVTGHRPGAGPGRSGAELHSSRDEIKCVFADLQHHAASQGGRIEVLTGAASGADLEAAEVALELGLAVHVILPLPEEEFANDFSPEESEAWTRAQRIISQAREGTAGATFRVARAAANRPECYYDASIEMLDHADALLAIWNGHPSQGLGGTAEVVEYAEKVGLPVIQIDPSRQGEIAYRKPVGNWPEIDPIWTNMRELANEEEAEYGHEWSESATGGPADRFFVWLDHAATRVGKQFRGRLVWATSLHFVAAIVAALNVTVLSKQFGNSAGMDRWGTIAELLLVSAASLLLWRASRARLHEQWRQSRFAAEILRGLRAIAPFQLDPLEPLVLRHAPEWRRFALSTSLSTHRSYLSNATLEERKSRYLQHRIEHQRNQYFAKQHRAAVSRILWFRRSGRYAGYAAVALNFLHLLANEQVHHWFSDNWLGALIGSGLPVILPLIAGAATSLTLTTDSTRRAERYRLMYERLDIVAKSFCILKTERAVGRAVATTENALLDELVEWYIAAANTGH